MVTVPWSFLRRGGRGIPLVSGPRGPVRRAVPGPARWYPSQDRGTNTPSDPPARTWGTPSPSQDRGCLPRYKSECCYTAGGKPHALMQVDFLV